MSSPSPDPSVIDHAVKLVRTVVNRQVSKRLSEASSGVSAFSGTIAAIGDEVQKRQPSEPLANLTKTLVERIDAVAVYLSDTDPDRVYADVRVFSGQRPAVAAGIAILAGFGLARVVKVAVVKDA